MNINQNTGQSEDDVYSDHCSYDDSTDSVPPYVENEDNIDEQNEEEEELEEQHMDDATAYAYFSQ